jgi:hypothetical protein
VLAPPERRAVERTFWRPISELLSLLVSESMRLSEQTLCWWPLFEQPLSEQVLFEQPFFQQRFS